MTVLMPFHTPFYTPLSAGVALGHFADEGLDVTMMAAAAFGKDGRFYVAGGVATQDAAARPEWYLLNTSGQPPEASLENRGGRARGEGDYSAACYPAGVLAFNATIHTDRRTSKTMLIRPSSEPAISVAPWNSAVPSRYQSSAGT